MDEDIISEESDGLGEDRIIVVGGRGNDPVIEDRVSEDIDQEDLSLGNGRRKRWMGISLVGVLRIKGMID